MDDFLLNEFKEFRKEYKHDFEILSNKVDQIVKYNNENLNKIEKRLSVLETEYKSKTKMTTLILWLFSIIAGLMGAFIGKFF